MRRSGSSSGDRVGAARVLVFAALAGSSAAAVDAQQPAKAAEAFASDYFAPFNPVTAEDMVRRVPGFTLADGDDRRGFAGAAGNVLIDGQRPSSKTPVSELLARISARDVLRLDLYSGGVDAAGASGETLILDVRLRPRNEKPTNTFVAQFSQLNPSRSINPLLVARSAFKASDASVNLAVQAQPTRRGRVEYEKELFAPPGVLSEQSDEFLQGDYYEYKLSAGVKWAPTTKDAFSVNVEATPFSNGRQTFSETSSPAGVLLRVEDSHVVGDAAWEGEVGADWERKLSDVMSFKLIGLASRKQDGSNERYTTTFASGSGRSTLINRSAESGETLGRGVLSWQAGAKHSINLGGEVAFNFLDSGLDIRVVSPLGAIDATPPVANTLVEETRGEVYVADAWQVSDKLKIETSVTFEASRIQQSGDAQQERTFSYWKPRVNAAWNADASNRFRFLVERDVAQLDFSEFASAVSLFDGTQNIGNPDLEPERTWRTQVEWERNLGAKGVIVVSLFHDQVDAVQDQIPIAGLDGPGNLGDGRRTGVRLDATAPLDALGLPRAELRLKGLVQETRVDDPVTGESRRFSEEADWNYSVDFRQPLPGLKLLWGALYEQADETQIFRFRELRSTGFGDPSIDLYVETTAIRGLVVRFIASEILQPVETRERRFFSPDRSLASNLSSQELRRAIGGYGTRSYALRISGRF